VSNLNIIQIVSDSFRRDFLGCYGNNWVHTEKIDAFAKDSLVFDKSYIASFPTIPHRLDLFTGRYTFSYSKWAPLPSNEVILSQKLRQAGYTTMLIADSYHFFRDAHNFDKGFDGWIFIRGQENDRFFTNPTNDPVDRKKKVGARYLQNISLRRFEEDYFTPQTMTAAVKWLELNYDKHEKFFLHVDTFDPHEPWDPPKWYVDLYDSDWKGGEIPGGAYTSTEKIYRRSAPLTTEELDRLRVLYAGEITMVDRWVGILLQKIEDLGLFEDTMVVFTSDHGTYQGEHGYLRKAPHLYEEVAHIPLIIRPPDSIGKKSNRSSVLTQPPDLFPTFLDLAGVSLPKTVQGKSLLPQINGEKLENHEIAVSTESLLGQQDFYPTYRLTVTSKNWSLINVASDAPSVDKLGVSLEPELYYLQTDPKQTTNLYHEKKEVSLSLQDKFIHFLESLGTEEKLISRWRKDNL
jgi:arylsulfatase A-like enzyme